MQSCIFEGTIRHRRFSPVEHSFRYRLFMLYLDLDELENGLFSRRWLWSNERLNLAQFRRSDHLGEPEVDLRQSVRQLVRKRTGRTLTGPIRLLTHLRYFGYRFNPVSFYFCFDQSGERVETIVTEINNTPWGEQHVYVLDEEMNEASGDRKLFRLDKAFHVSPFMGMDHQYVWKFGLPGRLLNVHMENHHEDSRVFDATLLLRRREISSRNLNGTLIRFPLMTVRVIGAIYWNALRLWLKGAPSFTHPAKLNLETQTR